MESQSDRSPRPPLDQVLEPIGTFETLPDGTLVPLVPAPKEGGSPGS